MIISFGECMVSRDTLIPALRMEAQDEGQLGLDQVSKPNSFELTKWLNR